MSTGGLVSCFLDNAQISSFIGCPTYGNVDNEYIGLLLPKYAQGKVTVVVHVAHDDADSLIVSNALNMSLHSKAEV